MRIINNILTVTLNPAYDIHYYIPNFTLEKECYIESTIMSAGGKGINISRALTINGTPNTAFMVAGCENSEGFLKLLNREGICCTQMSVEGKIRENITIHSEGIRETRISQDNFSITPQQLSDALDMICGMLNPDDIVAVAGRFPKGLAQKDIIAFLTRLSQKGIRLVLDSNTLTLDELQQIRPWLIKPNDQEVEVLLGCKVPDVSAALQAAKNITSAGIENVMVSLGENGMVYAGADGWSCHVQVPNMPVVSTVGAGDSTLAGFISATVRGLPIQEKLKTACAFGTAACLTEGTNPPLPDDIKKIIEKIVII